MRVERLVVIFAVFVTFVGSIKIVAQSEQMLWGTKKSIVFNTLREFGISPGVKPEPSFVSVVNEEVPRFTNVPKGWHTFEGQYANCYNLLIEEDGIVLAIRIDIVGLGVAETLASSMTANGGYDNIILLDQIFLPDGTKVPRLMRCLPGKGNWAFQDFRYFTTKGKRAVYCSLVASPSGSKGFNQLIRVLRSHYGKYESVCQEIANLF